VERSGLGIDEQSIEVEQHRAHSHPGTLAQNDAPPPAI